MKMPGLPQTQAQAATRSRARRHRVEFSFHDFLSIINPLQHLPVIGTLYRAITGDKIGTPEKIAGDTLYGGLWGAVPSVADAAFEAVTGKDVGDTVLALFTGYHDQPSRSRPARRTARPRRAAIPRRCNTAGRRLHCPDRRAGSERRGQRSRPARPIGLSEVHDPAEHGACHRAVGSVGQQKCRGFAPGRATK